MCGLHGSCGFYVVVFFFKQKTAYGMRISDWSSDVCSSDLFLINHFELFGLQQAWFALRERAAAPPVLRQPLFYRFVRHPLYAGFFLAFWATPAMTVDRKRVV